MLDIRSAHSRLHKLLKWEPGTIPGNHTHGHLHGMRGLLAISSFLWLFLSTFAPACVSNKAQGETYEYAIRIALSPILWNKTLIIAFFTVLSARAICLRFLDNPTADSFAGSVIRRTIRLAIPLALSSFAAYGISYGLGAGYLQTFKDELPNQAMQPQDTPENALQALNSVFNLFWVVRGYASQAANLFWPTDTLWVVSMIYQQSWTVYFLMVLLPFGRTAWRPELLGLFIAGAFWMCSWGMYSGLGLLLADLSTNAVLKAGLDSGLHVYHDWKIRISAFGCMSLLSGLAMKYVWAALPQYINKELYLHPYLDLSENTSPVDFSREGPYPRIDDLLVVTGVLLLLEAVPRLRLLLSSRMLSGIGKRSLS